MKPILFVKLFSDIQQKIHQLHTPNQKTIALELTLKDIPGSVFIPYQNSPACQALSPSHHRRAPRKTAAPRREEQESQTFAVF